MKTKTIIATMCLLLFHAPAFAATNDITELVRKGLFEEEANHNLDAAMQAYQAAVTGFDQDRQLAATAVFRLGECYRKLGRTNEANAQYQRILREFPDQSQLGSLSRANLSQSQATPADSTPDSDNITADQREGLAWIQQMINTSPDLINGIVPNSEETPLVTEASSGSFRAVALLLEHGADPNKQTKDGWMPICMAAEKGNKAIVELLLDHGAEVNGRNQSGKTALFYAVRDGYLSIVQILLAHHADPNLAPKIRGNELAFDGAPPIHAAAAAEDVRLLQLLIANGARINVKNNSGQTPLFAAVQYARQSAAQILLTKGANVNATDNSGRTPLFDAVQMNAAPLVELLVSNSATVNLRDANGITPLRLAKTGEMRSLLHAAGASDDYDRLGGIFVREKGSSSLGEQAFSKTIDAPEPHSLFQIIASYYGVRWQPDPSQLRGPEPGFPDLKHITVQRLAGAARQINVNLDDILKSGDCSRDIPLEWGDIVEISQTDHARLASWQGLPQTNVIALQNCLRRTVDIVVKGQTNQINLVPPLNLAWYTHQSTVISISGDVYSCDLNSVVRDCKLLLLSSDLAHVSVRRVGDPPREFNLETQPTPWFILRDGDVIDIPQK
jgi:ankyrin repeat protein